MSPAVELCGIHAAATCSLIKLFLLMEKPSRYQSVNARLIPIEVVRIPIATRTQTATGHVAWSGKANLFSDREQFLLAVYLNPSAHATTILFSWLACSLAWLNMTGSCKLSCC